MTTEEVSERYKPIDALIDSIPEETLTGENGVEYASPGFSLKVRLMLVVHHCKNMKLRSIDFPAPFSKSELSELVKSPYTKAKLEQAKDLQDKYRQLDEESLQKGGRVA